MGIVMIVGIGYLIMIMIAARMDFIIGNLEDLTFNGF